MIIEIVNRIGKDNGLPLLQDFHKDSPIQGSQNSMDSLSYVSLICELEERAEKEFNKKIVIEDELSGNELAYLKNVSTLADHIVDLINKSK